MNSWLHHAFVQQKNMRLSQPAREHLVGVSIEHLLKHARGVVPDNQNNRLHYIAAAMIDVFANQRLALEQGGVDLACTVPTLDRAMRVLERAQSCRTTEPTEINAARDSLIVPAGEKDIHARDDMLVHVLLEQFPKDTIRIRKVIDRRTRLRRLEVCVAMFLCRRLRDHPDFSLHERRDGFLPPPTAGRLFIYATSSQSPVRLDHDEMRRTAAEVVTATAEANRKEDERLSNMGL